jgi:divalent metal cation (Fe/Co/Zn/Cd) transporter
VRTDPTDNGGLFVGRRPGTAPVRYRALPQRGSARRVSFDRALALTVLALMVLVNLCFWGPIPAGWLWMASHIQYWTGSVTLGIAVAFIGMLLTLMLALMALKRLDATWILIRRAAGYDQRTGMIGTVFAFTAALGGAGFMFWLLFIGGLGPTLAPNS